jgi:GxxExxY protein
MHPLFEEADRLSGQVIAAALEVHRDKGPGLLESIYEWCLTCELSDRGFQVTSQKTMDIRYKQHVREDTLRFDLLVNGCLLIEVKAVEKVLPIHKAQLLSYLKLMNIPIGLLFNFHDEKLLNNFSRLVLRDANRI